MVKKLFFLPFTISFFISCSVMVLDSVSIQTPIEKIHIYVEGGIENALMESLDIYTTDLLGEGITSNIEVWEGDASSLRESLQEWTDGSHSAFLIGDMPAVFYEIGGESFPTDLFFSSPTTEWLDRDGDGIYDGHSALAVTVPVSRLSGSVEEMNAYFDKIHRYRSGFLYFDDSAIIFKDDDWSDFREGSYFGTEKIAGSVYLVEDVEHSTYARYKDGVNRAQKYLYQWIHANSYALYVQEEQGYVRFTRDDIEEDTVDVGFLNLFNCQAARYTQDNIGMTYLVRTDTALAVTGSTKKGGNFEPLEFHRSLAAGNSWAEAYRQWYNAVGVHDDMWYLGMVILGDPALIPEGARNRSSGTDLSRLIGPTAEEKDYYYTLMSDFSDSP